jgi:hypothetical protein
VLSTGRGSVMGWVLIVLVIVLALGIIVAHRRRRASS